MQRASKAYHGLQRQYIQNSGGIVASPDETDRPRGIERKFMHDNIVSLFETGAGSDITDSLNALNLDPAVLAAQKTCMRNLFFVGKVDTRGSASVCDLFAFRSFLRLRALH